MADNSDSGASAMLGVIVGGMLVVLVAIFAFGGGFQWMRGGGSPDLNVRIEAPKAPPSG